MNDFIIYEGAENQRLTHQIKKDSKPVDITGKTVRFKMRYRNSELLKVDQPAGIEDNEKGKVYYDWTDADIDEPGEYAAWFTVTDGILTYDTPEFLVIVTKHSPGVRTETGAIYERAKTIIPTTWQALEASPTYGDAYLQSVIEAAKLNVFDIYVPVGNEITYDIRVQFYIAKIAALRIIPTAIDYWMNQHETVSTQGGPGVEVVSYPDRIQALKAIQERLLVEISQDRAKIEEILGIPTTISSHGVPSVSDGGDELEGFVTPLPNKHFRDYAFPGRRADRYGWSTKVW